MRTPDPVGVVVIAGVAALLALILVAMRLHPVVLADPAAPVYLVSLGLVTAGYVAASLLATRPAARPGAIVGVVTAGLWLVEVWAGNAAPPGLVTTIVYRASTGAVLLTALAAGVLGGSMRGRLADGVSASLWGGMLSAIVLGLVIVVGTSFDQTVGRSDPATIAEFHRSGMRDLGAYIAADGLAAAINHLWIGLVVGGLGGLVGGALGTAIAGSRGTAAGAAER